jgi:DNA-binding CsgD family transcriptional regulator
MPGLVTALSDRELEVPHLLAAGKQNQDIADELHMALNTVKKHATHMFDKLGATNRSEATRPRPRARSAGAVAPAVRPAVLAPRSATARPPAGNRAARRPMGSANAHLLVHLWVMTIGRVRSYRPRRANPPVHGAPSDSPPPVPRGPSKEQP